VGISSLRRKLIKTKWITGQRLKKGIESLIDAKIDTRETIAPANSKHVVSFGRKRGALLPNKT